MQFHYKEYLLCFCTRFAVPVMGSVPWPYQSIWCTPKKELTDISRYILCVSIKVINVHQTRFDKWWKMKRNKDEENATHNKSKVSENACKRDNDGAKIPTE